MTDLITELHALAQRMAAAGETDEPVTEVIERLAISLRQEWPHHTGVYHWMIGMADELRQQTKEQNNES